MSEPIVNPEIPYVGEIPGGLQPGKMIRIQGVTHPHSDRFNINLATGPNVKPRDDTGLHLSVRLNQGYVARNTYKDGAWGDEQGSGKLPIGKSQSFEIILLIDPSHYKIAINGQHFAEFPYRVPFHKVSYLLIDGEVSITLLSFEGVAIPEGLTASQASAVHAEGPQGAPPQFGGPQYGPQGGYGPPPPNYGGYGPPPPPGAEPQSELGGFMEKAQDILAGAIKSGAAEKLLGSILHSGGDGQQQQQQGYAHQNARYGIYPDLPTQDTTTLPQNPGNFNQQDTALSGLISGSGGTITSGPQPIPQSGGNLPSVGPNARGESQGGPLEGLLMGILGGKGQAGGNQPTGGAGDPHNTPSVGSDLLSGLLTSLLSGNKQGDQPGGQNAPQYGGPYSQNPQGGANQPQNAQGGGSDVLSGILQSLLSGSKDQQGPGAQNQPPYGQTNPQNTQGGQGQGADALSGLLSSLLSSNQNNQNPATPSQPAQGQGGDAFSSILQNLVAGSNQHGPGGQNVPPQNYNQPPQNLNQPQNPQGGQNNAEMITNLLQGLLSKASEQHDNTRPIQETHPSGGGPHQGLGAAQDPQQQYGQYPHAQQQDQRGPMESLLSGLLSGGGGGQQPQQQQHQQPHLPQVGGEGSVGGLGSMGGILGSLAGSLLQRQATPGQLPTAHINPVALSYPINIKPGVIPPLPGQTQSYGHLQPIPAQTYGHSQPIPAKTYGHLQPIPAKTYEHSQPIPAQTYGQSQPVLAQTYGRPQPILAQTYGHPQQMPPQSYGHQPPIPSQSYGHSHPIPPQSYGHQPPIPSQSYGHSHPIPPQSYGNPQPGTHPSFGHSQVGTQHSLGHHLPGQLPYPVQHTSETARAMYPVQPIGFAGYPFPALGHSKKIKKPKKAKKASKKHHKHKSSSSSSSSSSDSN